MQKINLSILLTFSLLLVNGQQISDHFFGQNAWMPSWFYNGKLDTIWQKAKPANFEIIRIGGIEYEDNFDAHIDDFIRFMDSIKITCRAEPILQIPRNYSVQQTQDLYNYINVTHNKKVKYWAIGNEPDSHNPNTLAEIQDYFIPIAKALKDKNDTLVIIGPDYANYWVHVGDQYDAGQTTYSRFINGVGLEMNTAQTAYLLDVFAFHNYIGYTVDATLGGQDLERVVTKVKATLSQINIKRTLGLKNKATWAIGEFNISSDGSAKRQRWSFYAGQYFAMVYGVGMKNEAAFICPWSLIEGEYRKGSDLSMFENEANGFKPRSTFYHVKMLTDNRFNNYMTSTTSNSLVKSVGMKDETGSMLMVMNTSESINFATSIKLDLGPANSNELIIKADAGFNLSYTEIIPASTTITFVFDNEGKLVKRYKYNKFDADNFREPSVTFITNTNIDLNMKTSIGVYPVPTKGLLNITGNENQNSILIDVYDITGNVFLSQQIEGNQLDISHLPNGLYVIKIKLSADSYTITVIKN